MIIIVGLGNPGKKYINTWHNLGFLAIDKFKEINNFPDFKFSKKFNSLISEKLFQNKKIILAKPQTFMNNSGQAVKKIVGYYQENKNLIIINDDIDLPLGKIRVSKNRGSAGHKGVQSVIDELKTKNFTRIRIGINIEKENPKNTEKFVLQKFNEKEKAAIKKSIKETVEKIKEIIEN